MTAPALAGRRIVITRAAEDAERWAERLRAIGALPVVLPCLEIVPIANDSLALELRTALASASWLVLSSRRSVEAVARLLGSALPCDLHVAVVGPTTARAAAAELGRVDLVATESTAQGLADELLVRLGADDGVPRVVVAGASNGRTDVERALAQAGIPVTRVELYATVPAANVEKKRDLDAEGVDDILLASPSAAEGLVNRALVPAGARVITIGPTTSAAALAVGLTVSAEARRPDLNGMLEAIA